MCEWSIALIGAGGAIMGAAVSGFATYKAALLGFKRKQTQNQLLRALDDLKFMLEIEKVCLEQIENHTDKSIDALKRECRAKVRSKLGCSLSEGAEPVRLDKAIKALKIEI